jgi:hypothetical protein
VQSFQGGHKVAYALELAINRGEAHIGNFTNFAELLKHQFTDFGTAHFPSAALLQLEFDFIDYSFEPGRLQASFSQARSSPCSNLMRLKVSREELRFTTVMGTVSTRS